MPTISTTISSSIKINTTKEVVKLNRASTSNPSAPSTPSLLSVGLAGAYIVLGEALFIFASVLDSCTKFYFPVPKLKKDE